MNHLRSLEPADAETAASMLAIAAADGISLLPEGRRTKLRARAESNGAAALRSTALTSGLVHYAGDLVATAPAGATLSEVNEVLARERQWIPLDPPFADRATIGGIVACNDSGPHRHRFGSPRDLIIGIEVALTNGRVVHSGGRVVKNVAGYDLARLFCGSRGSLGLITSVTFKLAPLPPASRTILARFSSTAAAANAALQLSIATHLTPAAVDIWAPHPRLLVRFETTQNSADRMAASARDLLAPLADEVTLCTEEEERRLWHGHSAAESATDGIVATVSVLPTSVSATLDRIQHLADDHGLEWTVTGRAGLGALRVCGSGGPHAQVAFATALRAALPPGAGHLQILGLDAGAGETVDLGGPLGSAASVGLAVKRRFDPTGVLPYPWGRA